MTAARLLATLLLLAVAAAGCGSSDSKRFDLRTPAGQGAPTTRSLTAKEPVTPGEAKVIRAWAAQLRHGHVARAARYFALPAVVANGFNPVKISTRKEAQQFNKLLPCGAVVTKLERQVHHLVLTTFKLVTRTGPGAHPCPGGGTAQTAFEIRRGHIRQWLRVPDQNAGSGAAQSSS